MTRISGFHYFLHLFTNSTSRHVPVTALSLFELKLVWSVLRRVDIGRLYSSIAQDLKFDWSIQITCKRTTTGKSDFFEQAQTIAGTTIPKP